MKELAKIEKDLGSDGGKLSGALGIVGADLSLQISVSYPIVKVAEPILKISDALVDKLEALIPGDQKELADKAKLEARAELIKYLSEQQG
jgi:hypothetical protein